MLLPPMAALTGDVMVMAKHRPERPEPQMETQEKEEQRGSKKKKKKKK